MKDYLSHRIEPINTKTDIIAIGNKARESKKKYPQTINGSIGVFLNDDKSLGKIDLIIKSLKDNLPNNLSYPPFRGQNEYKDEILKWLLKSEYENFKKEYFIPFSATLGGTGALFFAFNLFLNENQTVILPSIMWSNYKVIALRSKVKFDYYELFDKEGKFNFASLEKKIQQYSSTNSNLLILINEPCQNPTGYCFSDEEYDKLYSLLNKEGKKTNLTCLFDIAYIDYQVIDKEVHPLFTYFKKATNFLPAYAFSCSKSFGVYGLRLGALFTFTKDKEFASNLEIGMASLARGIYSCPNGGGLMSVAKCLSDESQKDILIKQIYANSYTLRQRGLKLVEELEKNNIKHLPYSQGFFLSFEVKDALSFCEKLEEQKIFLVPLNEHIVRIALSCLDEKEIVILAKKLKEALENE
ncbi:MAG: aminotransferase class I/II-fold pyridoxal phosphate-dependent enzyme [Bacilli bacterium]|nr:aminotransferase class I/II-fold pyridoxal phosphate-dependent enzyme [Bacilli bacterium]